MFLIKQLIFLPMNIKFIFFADAPHLIKTGSNCLYHLGSGMCTWYTWNNQKYIIWNDVAKIVYDEVENGLKS